MRIRLEGSASEITAALLRLRETFIVGDASRRYPNRRGCEWRVYVDVHEPSGGAGAPAGGNGNGQHRQGGEPS